MDLSDRVCEICLGQSEGCMPVGVFALPGIPMSVLYGSICAARDAFPDWVFVHDFIFVCNGDVTQLNDWAQQRVCWDTRSRAYVPFLEFVKRITPEAIRKEQEAYYKALEEVNDNSA